MLGCKGGSNPVLENIVGPNVVNNDGNLVMSMVFKNLSLDGGIGFKVPKLSNSYFNISPDVQSQGTLIQFTIDARDIANMMGGVIPMDPLTLPGAHHRPLPVIANGVLPGFAFEVNALGHTVFYGGKNLFGAFIPVKLGLKDVMGTFKFSGKDKAGNGATVGTISIIGEGPDGWKVDASGILLMFNFAPGSPAGNALVKALR
jgi:hypothetical protein